ncbi:acyl-CoA desaturase [Mangrovitalea sediminis]|uniref:acyl-CoA desaturase n=1 Tax=Mangrovitalea sediminis TaxID=1982043 RepID=UPI000BE5B704|nr:acyl-CoA desaturase [Mangrovitalea sediminis]
MTRLQHLQYNIQRWFDAEAHLDHLDHQSVKFNAIRVLPFVGMHVACLGIWFVGVSPFAVGFAAAFFLIRMFAITGFYHRYFAHKTFKTSRSVQFIFALVGAMAAQRGALWWAAHHRRHHQHSDGPEDLHSPTQRGFWWAHVGWFTCDAGFVTDFRRIRDWEKFPELRFLNRFDALIPVLTILSLYGLGEWLSLAAPGLDTNGPQLTLWGFFVSTVFLFHATVSINSLSHVWGSRRFETDDGSRNNIWLALITLGEGWHNNHHRWPQSARQGFRWWEIDMTYYLLWLMQKCRLIWDLNPVPLHIQEEAIIRDRQRRRELKHVSQQ